MSEAQDTNYIGPVDAHDTTWSNFYILDTQRLFLNGQELFGSTSGVYQLIVNGSNFFGAVYLSGGVSILNSSTLVFNASSFTQAYSVAYSGATTNTINIPMGASNTILISTGTNGGLAFATAASLGLATGTPSYVDLGATGVVGDARLTLSYDAGTRTITGSVSTAGLATGTPIYVETDPTWTAASNTYWSIAGNANTTNGTHFIGTTDGRGFDIRVNNVLVGRFSTNAQPNIVFGDANNFSASNLTGQTICGGSFNVSSGSYSTISGGQQNTNTKNYATIGGGFNNVIGDSGSATHGTIAGGDRNVNRGHKSTIGGGSLNIISNDNNGGYATIAGGQGNFIFAEGGTIGGGGANIISNGAGQVICGGSGGNVAGSSGSAILGGGLNETRGTHAVVAGGRWNISGGGYSFIAGGRSNTASGLDSFAAGFQSIASNRGSFVWSDSQSNATYGSHGDATFNIRATGGVWHGEAQLLDGSGNVILARITNAANGVYATGTPLYVEAGLGNVHTASNNTHSAGTTNTMPTLIVSSKAAIGTNVLSSEVLTVGGNIAPSISNAYSLGTASLRWSTVYVASVVNHASPLLFINSGGAPTATLGTDGSLWTAGILSGTGVVNAAAILDGTIANGEISTTAAIAANKIANTALVQNTVFNGDIGGNYNSMAIQNNAITNTDINPNANIDPTKISGVAMTRGSQSAPTSPARSVNKIYTNSATRLSIHGSYAMIDGGAGQQPVIDFIIGQASPTLTIHRASTDYAVATSNDVPFSVQIPPLWTYTWETNATIGGASVTINKATLFQE